MLVDCQLDGGDAGVRLDMMSDLLVEVLILRACQEPEASSHQA